MRHVVAALALMFTCAAVPAAAADEQTATPVGVMAAAASVAAPATPVSFVATPVTPVRRPAILPALYAGSAALQAFDVVSTLRALNAGAHEANPVMQGVVTRPALFIGMKASLTAASIMATEQLWRTHHRAAAVGVMLASNAFMAAVAAHNAGVLARVQ